MNPNEPEAIVARLRDQAAREAIRITVHAHQEMVEDEVSYEEILEVLAEAHILEDYPEHRRGPCCLVCGRTSQGRFIHVVCTTSLDPAIIITVYEPKPPKWVSPFQRGKAG